MTKDGSVRKERIINKHFYERRTSRIILNAYALVLEVLEEYALLLLHGEQTGIVREVLGYFIEPEQLPKGAKKISSLVVDNVCWS